MLTSRTNGRCGNPGQNQAQVKNTADAQEPWELRPPSVQGDQHEEPDGGDRGLKWLGAADIPGELADVVVEVPVLVKPLDA